MVVVVILALIAVLVILFVVLPLIGMALWALISTVIVGCIIGALARLIIPGKQHIGTLATIVAGLCGSIVGGFLGEHVFHIGYLLTVLVEIGVAGVIVAAVSAGGRRQLPPARP